MILHLDMDAFFAAVEQRENPELKGKPVIVGGRSQRAVVSTASYEARVFGVKSAMPMFQAMKLCPQAIVVRGNMGLYKEISLSVYGILQTFSPLVEMMSIDEAYVDISGCERIFGPPVVMAEKIKQAIWDKEHLTCSIGITPLKFLSKIASDMNKPNGITLIPPAKVDEMLMTLPIHKVPGVGKRSLELLTRLGVKTLGDVKRISDNTLKHNLGVYGIRLKELSCGVDTSRVNPVSERKSISTEDTFSQDTGDRETLKTQLLMQADEVARQLRKKKFKGRTVTLKITFSDFRQITRRHTLETPIQSARDIFTHAHALFDKEPLPMKLRLIGLGVAGLIPENQPVQANLFEKRTDTEKWNKAERAMDSILGKFGGNTVKRASLNEPKKEDE